jgi:2-oxoisovalerate dehydrogenase E2 component (dihydrolipoyl transacylase)
MSEYIFKLPDLGEGMVEAEISEWMVKIGDAVEEEQAFCAMLTDKAAVELSAPVSGTVISIAGEEGDTIAVGSPLIVFETEGSTAQNEEPAGEAAVSSEPAQPATPDPDPTATKVATSPSIRQKAKDAGIDLSMVPGTGPRGRILKSDFEAYLKGDSAAPASQAAPVTKLPTTEVTEIKVVGLRRIIAERMTVANRDIPHFAYVEEVDVTALESLRLHLNAQNPDQSRLTLLPFLGLALVRALAQHPECNAHYDAERNVILRHGAVHLGIATQTRDGLKVPVVKHAESRTLRNLAVEISRVSEAARDNTATREELSGSTITITSLGKTGGIVTTPIINSPEVAIIGVGKAVERPVVIDSQIVVRRMMNLSSSFDHRFVDGYDAAGMIQTVKGLMEQPATIFID